MSNPQISWYSFNEEQNLCEHPPIDLGTALVVVEDYFAHTLKPSFASGEQALAETMFGFSRSPSEFIEVCLNGPSQISYVFELTESDASGLRKLLGGTFRYETELKSKSELIERVREFYTVSPAQIKRQLEMLK